MFESVNLIAVLGTTFFMLASATIWFSPLLFGKWWLQELKVTEAEIEANRQNIYLHLVLMAGGYFAALLVLMHYVVRYDVTTDVVWQHAGAVAVLVGALFGSMVLWENRSYRYFLVVGGFYGYFIVIGMVLLTYWPW